MFFSRYENTIHMQNDVFRMFYFYEYKIRVSQKLLLKTTQIDISQTKRVVLNFFEIRTVQI